MLNFVCGALVAHDAASGHSPYDGLDVERVFAAVELLSRRRELEVTPFVSAWHPAVDEWDRPELPAFWDRNLQSGLFSEHSTNRARDAIVGLIRDMTSGGTGQVYRGLMDEMIGELVALLRTTTKQVAYLESLAALGKTEDGVTIATLNYDLSIEQAASLNGVPLHTGIERWVADGRWGWPQSGIRLLKLHGSVDWQWDRTYVKAGSMSSSTVHTVAPDVVNVREPALVFGHGGKLRAEGPFLSLLAEFEAQLAVHGRLIVVGYSFRDDHVNELLRRWLAEDQANCLTVVDPGFPEHGSYTREGFRNEMLWALDPRNWRAEALTSNRLTVLRRPASEGLVEALSVSG